MESIVSIILSNLMELMPFRIVFNYEKGVRWTLGQKPVALEPGFHWCWWLYHSIEKLTVVEEMIDLPTQTVVTKDGKTVVFSVNIGRVIIDPVAHFCSVSDFDESTIALAMTHLHQRIRERDYDDLLAKLPDLERSLRGTLSTRFAKWGAEVTTVGFTDFTQASQFRLFQDQGK